MGLASIDGLVIGWMDGWSDGCVDGPRDIEKLQCCKEGLCCRHTVCLQQIDGKEL